MNGGGLLLGERLIVDTGCICVDECRAALLGVGVDVPS